MKPLAILCLASLPFLSACWYAKQAAAFLGERSRAMPVSRLSADPDSPDTLKRFLALAQDIRQYGRDVAGLKPTKNYTVYVAMDRDYVADVVSACDAASFSRHYWRYPFLGNLPYRGFYDREDALKEVERLKEAGLDVIMRRVDAFSSLGFFKDPLYSFMAGYDPDILAELILHESAHATLFIKGAEQFNEELATFVGRLAAEGWLAYRYGPDSPELEKRRQRAADRLAFTRWLSETARLLAEVYGQSGLSREDILARKARIIAERAAEYRAQAPALFTNKAYADFDMASINNAYLDLYRLYEEDLSLYQRWYDEVAGRSLPAFMESLSVLAKAEKKGIKAAMAARLGP